MRREDQCNRKRGRRAMVLGLAAAMMSGISGAGIGVGTGTGAGAGAAVITALADEAKGGYAETLLDSPGEGAQSIHAIKLLADGTLRAFAQKPAGQETALWDSTDNGETWTKAAVLPREVAEYTVTNAAIAPDGSGACVIFKMDAAKSLTDEDSFEIECLGFDAGGEILWETQRDQNIARMDFAADGELVTCGWTSGVFVTDPATGEDLRTLYEEPATAAAVCGEEAIILRGKDVLRYDIATGEPLEADQVLADALFAVGGDYTDTSGFGHPIIFSSDADGRLYYWIHDGIFCHVMGGSAVEQVVDGGMTSFTDPNLILMAMEKVGESFLTAWWNDEGDTELARYDYDPEMPAAPETELTVYSLRSSVYLQQVIAAFRKAHPEIYVNYRVGMTGEDALTASDALRTLSTDMLAGNGPDVLVLDGMDVSTYTDRGLLLDLADVLREAADTDGLVENIAYTYRQGGVVPAVPGWFTFPILNGVTEVVDQVTDLASIAALSDMDNFMTFGGLAMLPVNTARSCAPLWMGENGAADQTQLAAYFSDIKTIYDNGYSKLSETNQGYLDMAFGEAGSLDDDYYSYTGIGGLDLSMLTTKNVMDLGDLQYPMSWCGLLSADDVLGDRDIRLFKPTGEGQFVPTMTLAATANAREKEAALAFIRFALSREGQNANKYNGFAVNRKALEDSLYRSPFESYDADTDMGGYIVSSADNETGEFVELSYIWPDRERADALLAMIDTLMQRTELNDTLYRQVVDESIAVLRGEKTPEDAAQEMVCAAALMQAEK